MFGEIEGTGFEVLDERFSACFVGHVRVERLWSGGRWLEARSGLPPIAALFFPTSPTTG